MPKYNVKIVIQVEADDEDKAISKVRNEVANTSRENISIELVKED